MILENSNQLKNNGFNGFKSVEELQKDLSVIPKVKGVYVVINPEPGNIDFLVKGSGGFFKGKDPNVLIEKLKMNWINNATVLYIGQTGGNNKKSTLFDRVKLYVEFGMGKPAFHYGGRLIWQIKNHKKLIFAWKELPNQNPAIIEQELFDEFENYYGRLPFANLRR